MSTIEKKEVEVELIDDESTFDIPIAEEHEDAELTAPRQRRPKIKDSGRRTKLTPELQEKLVEIITAGNYASVACKFVGIAEKTYYNWLNRGEAEPESIFGKFLQSIQKAEAEAEISIVKAIKDQVPDQWVAGMTMLERKHPDRWGKKDRHEVTGKDGGPIKHQVEAVFTNVPLEDLIAAKAAMDRIERDVETGDIGKIENE